MSDQYTIFPHDHYAFGAVWPFSRAPLSLELQRHRSLLLLVRQMCQLRSQELKSLFYLVTLQPWNGNEFLLQETTYPAVSKPLPAATWELPRARDTHCQGSCSKLFPSTHSFMRVVWEAAQSSWPGWQQNVISFCITELLSFQNIPLSQNIGCFFFWVDGVF